MVGIPVTGELDGVTVKLKEGAKVTGNFVEGIFVVGVLVVGRIVVGANVVGFIEGFSVTGVLVLGSKVGNKVGVSLDGNNVEGSSVGW